MTDEERVILDYFAGRAMQAYITRGPYCNETPAGFARDAYVIAEAMLEERKKH